ncbi:MAG: hypothetical protein Q8P41_02335 [Pseudomonadota bacterium]|nr:hypothetical protein [Pseudomonadota bacterium]
MVAALKKNLRDDLSGSDPVPLLVVTNLDIQEPHRAGFLSWLRAQVPGSELVASAQLTTLLDRHPYVARQWRVGGLETTGAFEIPCDAPVEGRPPTPTEPADALDQVIRWLSEGVAAVDVVGPAGFGQADLAETLARRLRTVSDAGGGIAPLLPLLVRTESVDELDRELTLGVRAGQQRYLFLVPPSASSEKHTKELVARLRRRDDRLKGCASVAFLSADDHHALRHLVGTTEMRRIDLGPVEPERIQRWLVSAARTEGVALYPHYALALAHGCAGRPGDARAVMHGRGDGLEATFQPWIEAWAHDRGSEGADFVFLLLLSAPPAAPADEQGGAPVAQEPAPALAALASAIVLSEPAARRIAEGLERNPGTITPIEGDGYALRTELGAAAIARLILNGDRSSGRVPRLFAILRDLAPQFRLRACERAWYWLEHDAPAVEYQRMRRQEARSQRGHALASSVGSAFRLAALGPGGARESREFAREVLSRLLADPTIASFELRTTPSFDLVAAARRQLARRLLELFVACVRGAADVRETIEVSVSLSALPDGVAPSDLENAGSALVDPFRSDDALEGVLEALESVPSSAAMFVLARGAAKTILAAGVEWRAFHGSRFNWGTLAWNETLQLQTRRERLIRWALRQIETPARENSEAGWDILDQLWAAPGGPMADPPLPPRVRDLVEDCVLTAVATFSLPDAWDRWVRAERFVLRTMRFPNAPSDTIADAVKQFPRVPRYLAWRLLTTSQDLLTDPASLAARIRGGAEWREVVEALQEVDAGGSTLVHSVVRALSTEGHSPSAVADWLALVDTRRQVSNGWGSYHILTAWMRAEHHLFRRLLMGSDWQFVPSRIRELVLRAAVPVFAEELRTALASGDASSRTGCVAMLADLVSRPLAAAPEDVEAATPTLMALLDSDSCMALLLRLADHPSERGRAQVVEALRLRLQVAEAEPGAEQVVTILRRLCSGALGESGMRAVLRATPPRERTRTRDRAAVTIGEEVLDRLPGLADLGALHKRAEQYVARALHLGTTRWLPAVFRCAASEDGVRSIHLLAPELSTDAAMECIAALLRDADVRATWSQPTESVFWKWLIERLVRSVPACAERQELLARVRSCGGPEVEPRDDLGD